MTKRVLVAMSGGVDSSVAALLMKQQGHEVVGCTLNLWSYENRLEPYNECCSLEVRTVAKQLDIEHHFLDCGQAFKAAVVDPFIESYLAGQTPSPCGHCNRLVRFPLLLQAMERFGCDVLATGCDDDVFLAICNAQEALVEHSNITTVQPAVSQHFRSCIGVAPVALEDLRALEHDLAIVCDANLCAWQRRPH